MIELDAIAAHVAAEAWPSAVRDAVAAWRTHRTVELAELVDAISARIPVGEPPGFHGWRERAVTYDPVDAGDLIAHFDTYGPERLGFIADPANAPVHDEIATRTNWRWHSSIARLMYVCRWPPDPRVSALIVTWCERLVIAWPRGQYGFPEDTSPIRRMFAVVAQALQDVADVRVRERLHELIERSPGRSNASRVGQREIALAGIAAIEDRSGTSSNEATRDRIGELIVRVGSPPPRPAPRARPSFTPDALWRAMAEDPDDDEPRRVLGDALMERGDPRGRLFAAQLGEHHGRHDIKVAIDWSTWLGEDLYRLLLRKSSHFRRGMLDEIRIGPGSTPAWVFESVAGHRELLVVRSVRIVRVNPPDYARFIAALPNVRRLDIDSVAIATALCEGDALEGISSVVLRPGFSVTHLQLAEPLAGLALTELELLGVPTEETLVSLVEMFPHATIKAADATDPIVLRLLAQIAPAR